MVCLSYAVRAIVACWSARRQRQRGGAIEACWSARRQREEVLLKHVGQIGAKDREEVMHKEVECRMNAGKSHEGEHLCSLMDVAGSSSSYGAASDNID